MAGTGKRVVLVDCRHDKYGGRITCDVITDRGHSAAEEILRTGLAIPYFGKRKTHNWCELPDILPDVKDPLYQHLFSCGWEGIIYDEYDLDDDLKDDVFIQIDEDEDTCQGQECYPIY